MAVLKCKMCGAQIKIEQNESTATCRYCDSVQTIPKIDDENKLRLYERATELRLRCDFDQASSVFQSIVAQFPEEAEAYWGICLCRYGIEYVDDPVSFMKIPTCHRTNSVSIFADEDYLNTLSLAGTAKWKYEEEAQQIDTLQKKILEISKNEQPYDIFICYKETDEATGLRTDDSLTAQDIYTELIKNNYRVFFSRITLRGKAGNEYEPYIYSALSSARVMLVVGSKKEYFEAVWLKNEWSRYLDMMNGTDKTLIPCFEKITADELPPRLRSFQGLDMSNKIFFSDLMQNIQRICTRATPEAAQSAPAAPQANDIQRKEFDYTDGAYSGGAVGTKPHGYGIRYYNNADRYEGEWHMGAMQGKGTFYYADGTSWQGSWHNNIPVDGSGTYKGKNYTLTGTLQNGKLTGEGKHYMNGKLVKEGFFKDGKLDGKGIFYNNNGQRCQGEFRNGCPFNASGVFPITALRKDAFYSGTWTDGKASGEGTIEGSNNEFSVTGSFSNGYNGKVTVKFANGYTYKGDMRDADICGQGKTYSPNNTLTHEGEYASGKANGNGIAYKSDGCRFEGSFVNDKYFKGVSYNADNTIRFQGEYKDGNCYTGSGTIYYKDGRRFEGKITEGKLTDFGKMYSKENKLLSAGHYVNNTFIKGTLFYDNGNVYSGELKNSKFHGNGTYTYNMPNWKGSWKGEWRDGNRWTGQGLIVFTDENGNPTGKFYDGFLREGKACGKGLLVLEDKTHYVGEFLNDKIYNGTYFSASKTRIDSYVRGVSQNQRNQDIALGILKGLSHL